MAKSRTRRDLTVDEVVACAAAILRDDGEPGLTMRRVADECGVTPMALYHHVVDKENLIRLVVDDLVAESLHPAPSSDEDWGDAMVAYATRLRSVVLANPGAAAAWIQRPVIGPNMALVTERLFVIAAMGGFESEEAARIVDGVVLLVLGSLANDLTRPADVRVRLLDHRPEEDTPYMVRNMEAYAHRDPEKRFRSALRWMISGARGPGDRRRPTSAD